MTKPKIGVCGLSSCAGDQLMILNCENEILDIVSKVDIKSFIMAQSGNEDTELDIAFVEGTVSSKRDLDYLNDIRKRAGLLIAMGTCANWGGINAMRNDIPRKELLKEVYGEEGPRYFDAVPAQPLKNFVKVDLSIPGCPIEKRWLLRIFASFIHGDLLEVPDFSLCSECKMMEYECLLVERGLPCLGPITIQGCKARCPGHNIPCIGCHGPVNEANYASELQVLLEKGCSIEDIRRKMGLFAFNPDLKQIQFPREEKNGKTDKN